MNYFIIYIIDRSERATQEDRRRLLPLLDSDQKTNTKRQSVLLYDGDKLLLLVEQVEKLVEEYEEQDIANRIST